MNRAEVITNLNETNYNNVVAMALLPDDWRLSDTLAVLTLASWGFTEGGLHVHEAIEEEVLWLMREDPEKAMRLIETGGEEMGVDETGLSLDDDQTPEHAAQYVLEQVNSIVQNRN